MAPAALRTTTEFDEVRATLPRARTTWRTWWALKEAPELIYAKPPKMNATVAACSGPLLAAGFVADVTLSDGFVVAPGVVLTKVPCPSFLYFIPANLLTGFRILYFLRG